MTSHMQVGIIGASGFTGAELLRLCAAHPDFDVVVATGDSQAGARIGELYPSLAPAYGDRTYDAIDDIDLDALDLVFLGLPHGASQDLVPKLRDRVGRIVDLAADFRLHHADLYPRWYGDVHTAPDLLSHFQFGLPELFRSDLKDATLVAAPGCYVTTAVLALAPILKAGIAAPHGIIVDAASGVSGAGRAPKDNTTFCSVDEDFTAYGLLNHRHTPEMEQALTDYTGADVQLLFTPHLAPMNRGILATCYARPTGETSTEQLLSALRDTYDDEPFVTVIDGSPSTKATLGSNSCHVTARYDERTGWVMAIAALDNLVKGASGQAIQCANLISDLPEETGLSTIGLFP